VETEYTQICDFSNVKFDIRVVATLVWLCVSEHTVLQSSRMLNMNKTVIYGYFKQIR